MKSLLLLAFFMVAQRLGAQEQVAIMYVQSHLTEALLEACSEDYPDEAVAFDDVLARWRKANRRVIKKGAKAYEEIERSTGTEDPEAKLEETVREAVEKYHSGPREERRKTCDAVVDLLKRES